jgi:hypothetical protein
VGAEPFTSMDELPALLGLPAMTAPG